MFLNEEFLKLWEELSDINGAIGYSRISTVLKSSFGETTSRDGSIFIMPDGCFLNMPDTHGDVLPVLIENGIIDLPADADLENYSYYDYAVDMLGKDLPKFFASTNLNYIRCNNDPDLCYIEVPENRPTNAQLRSLEQWLIERVYTLNDKDQCVELSSQFTKDYKQYLLSEYTAEDLIKLIKRFYASGKLYEAKADTEKLIAYAGEDLTNRFLAVKNRLKAPESDLYYWIKNKTVDELEQAIINIENTKSATKAKRDIADEGAELVCESEHWKVYHITTFEASKKYGRDTKWCITGINGYGDKYWKEYTNDAGVKFYFLIAKENYDARGENSKFAIALYPRGLGEVFNQQDDKVHFNDIPYIGEVYIPGYDLNKIKEPTITTDYEIKVYSGMTTRGKVRKQTSNTSIPLEQALTEILDWISKLTIEEKNDLSLSWWIHDNETVIFNVYAPREGTIERILNNTEDEIGNKIIQALELTSFKSNVAKCGKCHRWIFKSKLRVYGWGDLLCPECAR